MLMAAFLVGLPIFFEVGFIILVPLVWNLARESKRSLLYLRDGADGAADHHALAGAAASGAGGRLRNCWAPTWAASILYGAALSLPMAIVERHLLRRAGSRGGCSCRCRRSRDGSVAQGERHDPRRRYRWWCSFCCLPVLLIFARPSSALASAARSAFSAIRSRRC